MSFEQIFFSGTEDPLDNTGGNEDNYLQNPDGIGIAPGSPNSFSRANVMTKDVTLGNFRVKLDGAPGSGRSYTFTVLQNGSPTGITVTIADSATEASDTTHTQAYSAGQKASIRITSSGTPTIRRAQWTVGGTIADDYGSLLCSDTTSTVSNSVTNYLPLIQTGSSTTENDVSLVMPTSGTLSTLYASHFPVASSGTGYTLTVRKNEADTSLTTVIGEGSANNNDTTHSFTFVAGDRISVSCVPYNSPTATIVQLGVVFTSAIPKEFLLAGTSNDALPTSGNTEYANIPTIGDTWSSTESLHIATGQADVFIKNLYVRLSSMLSSGSHTFTVRKNSSSQLLSTTIPAGQRSSYNTSNYFNVANLENISLQCASSNSEGVNAKWAITAGYNPPRGDVFFFGLDF